MSKRSAIYQRLRSAALQSGYDQRHDQHLGARLTVRVRDGVETVTFARRAAAVGDTEERTIPPPALPAERSEPALPGACDLLSIQHTPSVQQILLGLAPGGVPVTVPVGKLCHVGIVGSTGSGKSNLLRLILPQLQAVGARVVLCDPHYAPVDPVSGEDWRPIAQRLYQPPAYTTDAIGEVLHWLLDELDTRLEQRQQQQPFGPPLFLALDELPVIADTVPGSMAALGRLLKEGRKVWLYVIGAAQSMLVKAIGGDSAARDNYRTAYYVGGDLLSARVLLDVPQRAIDEGFLTPGLAYLRSSATTPARLVRVPLVSNQALVGLLGGADSGAAPVAQSEPAAAMPHAPRNASASGATDCVPDVITPEIIAQVQRCKARKLGKVATIDLLWGVKPGGGSAAYQRASALYDTIMRESQERERAGGG